MVNILQTPHSVHFLFTYLCINWICIQCDVMWYMMCTVMLNDMRALMREIEGCVNKPDLTI